MASYFSLPSLLFIFTTLIQTSNCYETKYFTQYLDHFNFEANPQTFQQRWLIEDKHWSAPTGPIFFYTGNEGDIVNFYENSGAILVLAQKYHALVVFAEHRYYGRTLPFGTQSHQRENIGYLSVENALGDYAELIRYLQANVTSGKSPVVAFGGSYGGSLASYFRMRYPQIVDAALSASAPILLYPGVTDSTAFFKVITEDFTAANAQCPVMVRKAFSAIESLSGSASGRSQIQQEMRLCSPLKSDQEVDNVLYWARNAFVNIAMLDYPYPTDFGSPLPAWPVKVGCEMMLAESVNLLSRFANLVGIYYNGTQNLPCFNITQEFFQCADPSGCGGSRTDSDALSWDYQACTEMIHNMGTSGVTDMFPASPWSLMTLTSYCQATWGVTPRPHWNLLNTNLKSSSKIIFSNGALDPWHSGGVLNSSNPNLKLVWIEQGAHHLDLRAPNPQDPESVIRARQVESDTIGQWLREAYQERNIAPPFN